MKLFLYGNLAEAIGREVDLTVGPGATVDEVRRALGEQFPQALPLLGEGVRGCIGDQIVGDDAVVPDSTELAFFPPLSGG